MLTTLNNERVFLCELGDGDASLSWIDSSAL